MEKKSSPTASTAETAPAAKARRRGGFLRLLRHPAFPFLLQAAALAGLVSLVAAGWGRHGIAGVPVEGPLIYTNLATLVFWTVWMMGLFLVLPLAGRLWCTVCPVGLCNDLSARIGAKLPWPRRLQNFSAAAGILLLFTAGAEIVRANRYPDYTAWLLGGVTAAAVAAGLLFRGRAFCRWLCPVGGMIGLFARISPLEVGSRDHSLCRRCETKACWLGESRWYRLSWSGWHSLFRFRRPGCPACIFPPEAASNANCLMCTECFKNCPYDNLRWGTRAFGKGLWSEQTRDRSEALVLTVLLGIVTWRLARFWGGARDFLEAPAAALATAFPGLPGGAVLAVNYLFVFLLWPGLFLLLIAGAATLLSEVSLTSWPADGDRSAGLLYDLAAIDEERQREERGWASRRRTVTGYLAAFGHSFIPLVAGAFAAFALVKLNEKAAWLPLALSDPAGIRSWLAVNELALATAPESILPLEVVRWGAFALSGGGLLLSLLSAGRIGAAVYGEGTVPARRGAFVFRLGLVAAGALLLGSLAQWLFRGGW